LGLSGGKKSIIEDSEIDKNLVELQKRCVAAELNWRQRTTSSNTFRSTVNFIGACQEYAFGDLRGHQHLLGLTPKN
jgi:hypothetical protein